MGLTTASLHFYEMDRATLAPLLKQDVLIRENNTPWLTVLLPEDACAEPFSELQKIAKRITKSGAAEYALLFLYFDDEQFQCILYRGGKRAASCSQEGSWAKLGKALDQIFCDGAVPNAFRYATHCMSMEEKISLLEESVGTALLDCAEEESRTVPRSDQTLKAIKTQESALRKRPNQYALTELPVEEWPENLQAQLRLFHLLKSDWYNNHSSDLLYRMGDPDFRIPQHPQYAVLDSPFGSEDSFPRCRADSAHPDFIRKPARISQILWLTPQDETVCLYAEERTSETCNGVGYIGERNKYTVVCLKPDGTPRWRYDPPDAGTYTKWIHTDPDGVITLFVQGCWCKDKRLESKICRIDGSTGELLCERTLPEKDDPENLKRVDALNGYVYLADRRELVVLNEALEEVSRMESPGPCLWSYGQIVGTILWDTYYGTGNLWRCDLRTGTATETKPEIPANVSAVLPSGCFLGGDHNPRRLTVFDPDGTVISRHTLKGNIKKIFCVADRAFVLEICAPDIHGITNHELIEGTVFHLWRLDPIPR